MSMLGWMLCLNISSSAILVVIVILGRTFGGEDSYIRFGPGTEDFTLTVLSLNINSWLKWSGLVALLILLTITDVVISQTAMVTVYNAIYNPSVKNVTDFRSGSALQLYAQLMYGINSIRYILSVKVSITQVDFALITAVATQLIGIGTIYMQIKKKTFEPLRPVRRRGASFDSMGSDVD